MTTSTATRPAQQTSPPGDAGRLVLYLAAVAAVAFLGSLATRDSVQGWYAEADKPPYTPPDWLFAPVWTTLYVAMAVAVWLAWRHGASTRAWWIQLALNLAWTPVFFGLQWLWAGLVVIVALVVAILATIQAFRPWSRTAAWLMAPYLAWVLFATALNAGVAFLN